MRNDRPLRALETPPGDRLTLIVRGEPPFERQTNYEPSLLPHLAGLCHDFSIGDVIVAANIFGDERGHPLAWPQLWESTFGTLVRRFASEEFDGLAAYPIDRIEIDTYRAVLGVSDDLPQIRERIQAEASSRTPSLLARVISAQPDEDFLVDFVATHDPMDVDAEGIRCVLVAADRLGVAVDPAWIDRAVGRDGTWAPPGRVAHILPAITRAEVRTEMADRLVEEINYSYAPPWFVALAVSRIAPHVSGSVEWDIQNFGDSGSTWRMLIDLLLEAGAVETLAADVMRAHPYAADLAAIEEPHETSGPVFMEIVDAWAGAPEMAVAAREEVEPDEPPDVPDREQPVQDDRRLGVDAYADGKRLKNALIGGRPTEIEVSIAPEAADRLQLSTPVDIDFDDAERLTLRVRLVYGETELWEKMRILRDPTTSASVTFEVQPEGSHFNALIVVYNDDLSKVIEAAAYEAEVLPPEQEEQDSPPTMQLLKVPATGIGGATGEPTASVVTDGERAAIAAPQTPIPATANDAAVGIGPVTSTFLTAARNYVALEGAFDITAALIEAARFGYRLRTRLNLDAIGHMTRIQVISVFPKSVFPLELVYDGQPPDDNAILCPDWKAPLETGACPSCTDLSDTSVVCPLRFWGLSKVIEHISGSTTGPQPFAARELLPDNAQPLSPPSITLIGASSRVLKALVPPAAGASSSSGGPTEPDPEALLGELAALAADLGSFSVVDDWDEWRDAVGEKTPNLLIAMPHQDTKGATPALELGGELETTFVESHVRKAGARPGPIVLLLGCDTSNAPDLIGSFASDFRIYAPVVVATIGKVVAKEAPLVAAAIVEQLKKATEGEDATIGAALLAARRTLMADSRLVGLQLIGFGDPLWEVRPS